MIITCNVNKITDEFQKAGIIPYPVFDNEDGTGDFTFEDGTDIELVQQIIDAHDPTPLPPQPTETEILFDYVVDVDFRVVLLELGI